MTTSLCIFTGENTAISLLGISHIISSCNEPKNQNVHNHCYDKTIPSICGMKQKTNAKHTAAGIPTWSPTVVLICRSTAYVWQSGRDAQFSADCGRMCLMRNLVDTYTFCTQNDHRFDLFGKLRARTNRREAITQRMDKTVLGQ